MRKLLTDWLPTPNPSQDRIGLSKWLAFPRDPRLRAPRRHSVALGAGIGALASVIPLPVQIPIAVLAAVWLRAHVAAAAAATLISNPLTIVPMWSAAWKIGAAIAGTSDQVPGWRSALSLDGSLFTWTGLLDALSGIGLPLLIGLPILGAALGLTVYGVVMLAWRFTVRWQRRTRPAC